MRSTLIISNPVQNLAVLHCKVFAEHYNVLSEKINPSGFLSSWVVVSMTGSVEPRAPKLLGLLSSIKTLKRGLGPSKRPPPARMKLPDGTFASSAEENTEVFVQHFEKL